jgi:hypothetical protein
MTRRQDNRRQDNHRANPPEWKISEVHNPMSHVLRDFDGPDSLRDFGVREFQTLQSIFSLHTREVLCTCGVIDRALPHIPHDRRL